MPLSEHEQRLLDQIERALYAEDPKFASSVRKTDLRAHMRRRLRRAAYVLALGVVLLLVGVTTNLVVGVAGFGVMLLALLMALSAWKRLGTGPTQTLHAVGGDATRGTKTGKRPNKPAKTSGSVRSRLEERWKRRWDERGR